MYAVMKSLNSNHPTLLFQVLLKSLRAILVTFIWIYVCINLDYNLKIFSEKFTERVIVFGPQAFGPIQKESIEITVKFYSVWVAKVGAQF